MAVPTASAFLLRFPEFGEQSLSVVEGSLAEAGRFVSTVPWGALHTDAVSYMAAHLLASRIMQIGEQVGASSGTPSVRRSGPQVSSTLYGQEYERLLHSLPISGFAL